MAVEDFIKVKLLYTGKGALSDLGVCWGQVVARGDRVVAFHYRCSRYDRAYKYTCSCVAVSRL
jgi:hypothetical protein